MTSCKYSLSPAFSHLILSPHPLTFTLFSLTLSLQAQFAGDNFTRSAGDTVAMQKMQLFSWQAEARGNDLHLNANPTVNEIQFRQYQEKKEKLRESTRGSILERYGGQEHFDSVPKELLTGQTENYVEYSRTGQVIKGQERSKAKSKYEEDGEYLE